MCRVEGMICESELSPSPFNQDLGPSHRLQVPGEVHALNAVPRDFNLQRRLMWFREHHQHFSLRLQADVGRR